LNAALIPPWLADLCTWTDVRAGGIRPIQEGRSIMEEWRETR
jgi:hypothetical protein